MSDLKTTEVFQKELLTDFAEKFSELDEEFKQMMGTTVINENLLRDYLFQLNLFYPEELTEMKKKIHQLENIL